MVSSSTSSTAPLDSWIHENDPSVIECLCLGTGRFLRAVLVPALAASGCHPALIQPRGTSFVSYLRDEQGSFPVDTVTPTGEIQTDRIKCYGAFTLGSEAGKKALFATLPKMKGLCLIGVGVTEAGLASHDTQAMQDLYSLLQVACELRTTAVWGSSQKLVVLNTDNVPKNGDVICQNMIELVKRSSDAAATMMDFVSHHVAFLNTMVDRITSQRPDSGGMVPMCEPLPAKALVICDDEKNLPQPILQNQAMLKRDFGVVIRSTARELQNDIGLKLRIANGTHTALAHPMALCEFLNTDVLTSSSPAVDLLLQYLESLVQCQILPAAKMMVSSSVEPSVDDDNVDDEANEAVATWLDWKKRLLHPKFGLSTLFITQNGAQKGGIRLGPTITDLIEESEKSSLSSSGFHDSCSPITLSMCFSIASLLRFLTPISPNSVRKMDKGIIYQGWFDAAADKGLIAPLNDASENIVYADGLGYSNDSYEFRNTCHVSVDGRDVHLSDMLAQLNSPLPQQPAAYWSVVRAYLKSPEGGNLAVLSCGQMEPIIQAIAMFYARMVVGDGLMNLLDEIRSHSALFPDGLSTSCTALTNLHGVGGHLHYRPKFIPDDSGLMKLKIVPLSFSADDCAKFLSSVVTAEVQGALVIDLHTHLLPPSHGALCLWGIDELLTYHYLVAEYFITAPPTLTPQDFYGLTRQKQADLIWESLFLQRSPVSEACRGVLTTLCALGLGREVDARDLKGIRRFYSRFRDGVEVDRFSELIFNKAGVKYAVMTNIPFEEAEARYWKPQRAAFSDRFRSALRVDPLVAGDRAVVEAALKASGYDATLEGARQYLRDWCKTMKPEYMMASTPHDFVFREGSITGVKKTGVDEEAMKQPFAFVEASRAQTSRCDSTDDEAPSVIDENSDFLSEVLMRVCEELDLPLALKIGAHRGVNPALGAAGDGIVAFADAGVLGRLCTRFPKVRFLATFLSRNNQHEACVLASKFPNIHLYGCWWYSNTPSLIEEITKMRVEMLGTAFTAQHSDARVLDQLIYKWAHSRAVISQVLCNEYKKLIDSGWTPTRAELRRDINRLFGGSYEEFMNKRFTAN